MTFEKGTEAWKLRKNFTQPKETPEEIASKVEEFFANPPTTSLRHRGEVFEVPRITMEDVAKYCGYRSGRQFWYDMEKRGGEWKEVADMVRSEIASHYQIMGQHVPGTFPQFMLGNLGYTSKQEIDHTSSDGSMRPTTVQLVAPDDNSED